MPQVTVLINGRAWTLGLFKDSVLYDYMPVKHCPSSADVHRLLGERQIHVWTGYRKAGSNKRWHQGTGTAGLTGPLLRPRCYRILLREPDFLAILITATVG